jgi:hypothetical protein
MRKETYIFYSPAKTLLKFNSSYSFSSFYIGSSIYYCYYFSFLCFYLFFFFYGYFDFDDILPSLFFRSFYLLFEDTFLFIYYSGLLDLGCKFYYFAFSANFY